MDVDREVPGTDSEPDVEAHKAKRYSDDSEPNLDPEKRKANDDEGGDDVVAHRHVHGH